MFTFIYKAPFSNGLTEHEHDHVFVGRYEGNVRPNPEEVNDYKWMSLDKVKDELAESPEKYSPWFGIIMNQHSDKIEEFLQKEIIH